MMRRMIRVNNNSHEELISENSPAISERYKIWTFTMHTADNVMRPALNALDIKLGPGPTLLVTFYQPLYASTKQIQWK